MATRGLPMPTNAQSNSPKVGHEYGDHESHGAYRETHPMMRVLAEVQPTHPETVMFFHSQCMQSMLLIVPGNLLA
jgi:hypothetical protein